MEERCPLNVLHSIVGDRDQIIGQDLIVLLLDRPRQFEHLTEVNHRFIVALLCDVNLGDVFIRHQFVFMGFGTLLITNLDVAFPIGVGLPGLMMHLQDLAMDEHSNREKVKVTQLPKCQYHFFCDRSNHFNSFIREFGMHAIQQCIDLLHSLESTDIHHVEPSVTRNAWRLVFQKLTMVQLSIEFELTNSPHLVRLLDLINLFPSLLHQEVIDHCSRVLDLIDFSRETRSLYDIIVGEGIHSLRLFETPRITQELVIVESLPFIQLTPKAFYQYLFLFI